MSTRVWVQHGIDCRCTAHRQTANPIDILRCRDLGGMVAFDELGLPSRAVAGLFASSRTEVCCLRRGGIIVLDSWKMRVIVAV